MFPLQHYIRDIPDFPTPGILFRDITPLLRDHFEATISQLSALVSDDEWRRIDAVAGIEARGFILAAALAARHAKGFVPIRKEGKLPPPVSNRAYELEYGAAALEMQHGDGRLLIVDDVLATGGTMAAAGDLAAQAGYDVVGMIALIDLKLATDFTWNGYPIRSVIRYGA